MIDSAQKRGELIGHLEAALELADELNGGRTGFLIGQALTRRERNNSSRSRPSHLTHERVPVAAHLPSEAAFFLLSLPKTLSN